MQKQYPYLPFVFIMAFLIMVLLLWKVPLGCFCLNSVWALKLQYTLCFLLKFSKYPLNRVWHQKEVFMIISWNICPRKSLFAVLKMSFWCSPHVINPTGTKWVWFYTTLSALGKVRTAIMIPTSCICTKEHSMNLDAVLEKRGRAMRGRTEWRVWEDWGRRRGVAGFQEATQPVQEW